MLQMPSPLGKPITLRDCEIRWFEPVIAARHSAEQPLVVEADFAPSSPQTSQPRPVPSWRDIRWVEFAGDAHVPAPAGGGALQPAQAGARAATRGAAPVGSAVAGSGESRPKPADAEADARGSQQPAAATGAPSIGVADKTVARGGAVIPLIAVGLQPAGLSRGAARRLRQPLRAGISRLLRLAAAAASMGVVAVFAYQGGERLAGLAGAMTRPAAAPAHQAAAIRVPDRDPAPTLPPNDPIDPAFYYLDRASAGDPVAQYNLAVLYARGDGPGQDFSSAAAWFDKAAAAGNVAAQFNLAVIYERGLGVPQNMGEAIAWYRRAAEHNYAAAQYNLAIAYGEGRGMPRDAVAAARWYYQAAVQGLVPAMVNFAIAYEKGEGVKRSLSDAYAWYRAAARGGDGVAERRARELFERFSGAEKGKAVVLAAAIAGTIHEPASHGPAGIEPPANEPPAVELPGVAPLAQPVRASPKTAGPGGPGKEPRPGSGTGRAVLEPDPRPIQSAG